jgi:anti-sigma regulatory factor (Ser/Thr protein kinase)
MSGELTGHATSRSPRSREAAIVTHAFGRADIATIRRRVIAHAQSCGFGAERCTDIALVVSELLTNSLVHGGGGGTLRTWMEGERVVHEVTDRGHIADPAAGTQLPPGDQPSGRGLWLIDHLADEVQRLSTPAGTITRVALGPQPRLR